MTLLIVKISMTAIQREYFLIKGCKLFLFLQFVSLGFLAFISWNFISHIDFSCFRYYSYDIFLMLLKKLISFQTNEKRNILIV